MLRQPEHTTPMSHLEASGTAYSDLIELVQSRPQILDQLQSSLSSPAGTTTSEEPSLTWLLDFYPSMFSGDGLRSKEAFPSRQENQQDSPPSRQNVVLSGFGATGGAVGTTGPLDTDSTPLPAQEMYQVCLSAPVSTVQRMDEDTLTYLNRGQFYSITFTASSSLTLPDSVKTVLYLCFFDQSDKKVEASHWQYWHNLQANPDQRVFDIDYKNCENICGKPLSVAHNATAFIWCPRVGARIVFRVNCLSTEFSSQKGVTGMPMHFVTDTYEDIDKNCTNPVHRAYCRVKMFRDKGAERKHKEEAKTVKRKITKFKQQSGNSQEGDASESFCSLNKETILTSTSTQGPKPYLFVPQQESSDMGLSSALVSLKEQRKTCTFSNILKQAKDNLDALEIDSDEKDSSEPVNKSARIPIHRMTIVYVRKDEEEVYHALYLDSLTVHDFKLQVACKYDIPADMISGVYRKTKKKGLIVHVDDAMVSQFQDEDDFIISLIGNHAGNFDVYIHY